MTNRERYAKEILNIACTGSRLALVNGKIHACDGLICGECDLYDRSAGAKDCSDRIEAWCNSEYIEPPVDWSKVPIDTPILVRDLENGRWRKRHFAKYEGGKVYAFERGRTSWSQDEVIYSWEYAKLATDDELNANSILRSDGRKEE